MLGSDLTEQAKPIYIETDLQERLHLSHESIYKQYKSSTGGG